MKSWFHDNGIAKYLIHHKGKSVVTKRFLKSKIYKYVTAVSNNG